ncbi:MAG: hypothetical protein EA377_11235 [Phycisphaerales bacterium]|nr:MAG: hypothetical protein EA377_11235 [Phycisphaerales bacterium]
MQRQDERIRRRHGFSRQDLLAVLVTLMVLFVLAALLLPLLTYQRVGQNPMVREGVQLRGIYQSIQIMSEDFAGDRYVTPAQVLQRETESSLNTTASFYSMMIMQNYFSPNLVISRRESNPRVREMTDYDWDLFDPAEGIRWDDAFQADLTTTSNTSYAHLLLHGARLDRHWRTADTAHVPLLGNRGPRDGVPDASSYTCDDRGRWHDQMVVTADGASHRNMSMTPANLTYGDPPQPDNVFAMEDGPEGEDVILTFTKEIRDGRVVIQHD